MSESILDADKPVSLRTAKKEIREWILKNCILRGGKRIDVSDDFVVDCDNEVQYRNNATSSLTNGKFSWGYVRDFNCSFTQITSLEGAPKNARCLIVQVVQNYKTSKVLQKKSAFLIVIRVLGCETLKVSQKKSLVLIVIIVTISNP